MVCICLISSCTDEAESYEDPLTDSGILGSWLLEARIENGFTHLANRCCEVIAFELDEDRSDFKGKFKAIVGTDRTDGVFTLVNGEMILFEFGDDFRLVDYTVNRNRLQLIDHKNLILVEEIYTKNP